MGSHNSRFKFASKVTPKHKNSTADKYIDKCILASGELDVPGILFEYDYTHTDITDIECCICYDDYCKGMIMHMLPCDHIFHDVCIYNWFKKDPTCPLCRGLIS